MIEHSTLLSGIARQAAAATERKLRLLNKPPLSQLRVYPPVTQRTGASDDLPPSRSSIDPRGSAVEAGRPANPSTSDECDCAVCSSDLAGIVPCERENDL
ncbi:hypothetical protein TZ53_13175 [Sphingobium sp. YBL2]|nr:hypothetical protein TZ53_13175 [Sphingobium sp. YBL2]